MKSIKSTRGIRSIKSRQPIVRNIVRKNDYLDQLLGKPVAAYEKFNEATKIKKMSKEDVIIDSSKWPETWKKIYYKSYGRFEEIMLPKPKLSLKVALRTALHNRKSIRDFSAEPITLNKLSNLIYYSAGIFQKTENYERRFYPSPGARFPLEMYILSLNSELPMGFYHYYVRNNSLERMFKFEKRDLNKITTIPWVKSAGILIFITSIFERNTIKYVDRGYRHILVEAGHVAQNFYLNAAANGLGICAIGGYMDDGINEFLELDGISESVIYTLVIGSKK